MRQIDSVLSRTLMVRTSLTHWWVTMPPSLPLFTFCLQVAIDREKWMVSQLRNWFWGRVALTEDGKGRAILRDRGEGGIKNTKDDWENLMDIYCSIFIKKYIQNICVSICVCIYK